MIFYLFDQASIGIRSSATAGPVVRHNASAKNKKCTPVMARGSREIETQRKSDSTKLNFRHARMHCMAIERDPVIYVRMRSRLS